MSTQCTGHGMLIVSCPSRIMALPGSGSLYAVHQPRRGNRAAYLIRARAAPRAMGTACSASQLRAARAPVSLTASPLVDLLQHHAPQPAAPGTRRGAQPPRDSAAAPMAPCQSSGVHPRSPPRRRPRRDRGLTPRTRPARPVNSCTPPASSTGAPSLTCCCGGGGGGGGGG